MKPMMMPSEALASMTSRSVMPPTPLWMTLTRTFSVARSSRLLLSASREPCTSAFTTSLSSCCSPLCIMAWICSRVRGCATFGALAFSLFASATSWAFLASVTL